MSSAEKFTRNAKRLNEFALEFYTSFNAKLLTQFTVIAPLCK